MSILDTLYTFHNGKCYYCWKRLSISDATKDHVIPRSCGGMSHPSNYVLACQACNAHKGSLEMREWVIEKFPYSYNWILGRPRMTGTISQPKQPKRSQKQPKQPPKQSHEESHEELPLPPYLTYDITNQTKEYHDRIPGPG